VINYILIFIFMVVHSCHWFYFWVLAPWGCGRYCWCFGGTCYLHLHGWSEKDELVFIYVQQTHGGRVGAATQCRPLGTVNWEVLSKMTRLRGTKCIHAHICMMQRPRSKNSIKLYPVFLPPRLWYNSILPLVH
jgi:hypothetical protein